MMLVVECISRTLTIDRVCTMHDCAARYVHKHICANTQSFCVAAQVHAEDEMEHAAIGHEAVRALVPSELASVVARAAHDHDRDFAAFYNAISAVLEGH